MPCFKVIAAWAGSGGMADDHVVPFPMVVNSAKASASIKICARAVAPAVALRKRRAGRTEGGRVVTRGEVAETPSVGGVALKPTRTNKVRRMNKKTISERFSSPTSFPVVPLCSR